LALRELLFIQSRVTIFGTNSIRARSVIPDWTVPEPNPGGSGRPVFVLGLHRNYRSVSIGLEWKTGPE
jgi:hypothetical protein